MSDSQIQEHTYSISAGFCIQFPGVIYCEEDDTFYNYEDGYYKKVSHRDIRNILINQYEMAKSFSFPKIKTIVERIADKRKYNIHQFNMEGFINFENGLFDLKTYELKKHSKDVLSTIRLPYKYDAAAVPHLWINSLDEIFESDNNKKRTFQEYAGYCFTRNTEMEKALVMIGEGANGKSTLINTIRHAVGNENCSSLSLRYFADPQKVSVIKGKLINICGEVPKQVEDYEAEFRTIVTGEPIQISPKYIPDYTIKPYCKLIMAVNEFPHIDDKTSAFYRRLLIIPLTRQFSEEDQNKNLREELLKELPGVFNWAMEGLKRLQERKTFLIDEYMKQEIEAMKEINNPVMQWCKDRVLIIPGQDLVKGDAFEDYKSWSIKNGYKPFGLAKFGAEVFKNFIKYTDKDRRQSYGNRDRYWPGLALNTPQNSDIAERFKFDKTGDEKEWEE